MPKQKICAIVKSFPVLLILAQNHKRCLETEFEYHPPDPTPAPEYYEALDALYHTLYGGHDTGNDQEHGNFPVHGHQPDHTHKTDYSHNDQPGHSYDPNCPYTTYGQDGPLDHSSYTNGPTYPYFKPCTHTVNGYSYKFPSYNYKPPTYGYKPSTSGNKPPYGYNPPGSAVSHNFPGTLYNSTDGLNVNYAPNQVHTTNNRIKIVVKRRRFGRRRNKFQKIQDTTQDSESFPETVQGFFQDGRQESNRRVLSFNQNFFDPKKITNRLTGILHLSHDKQNARPEYVYPFNRPSNGISYNTNQNYQAPYSAYNIEVVKVPGTTWEEYLFNNNKNANPYINSEPKNSNDVTENNSDVPNDPVKFEDRPSNFKPASVNFGNSGVQDNFSVPPGIPTVLPPLIPVNKPDEIPNSNVNFNGNKPGIPTFNLPESVNKPGIPNIQPLKPVIKPGEIQDDYVNFNDNKPGMPTFNLPFSFNNPGIPTIPSLLPINKPDEIPNDNVNFESKIPEIPTFNLPVSDNNPGIPNLQPLRPVNNPYEIPNDNVNFDDKKPGIPAFNLPSVNKPGIPIIQPLKPVDKPDEIPNDSVDFEDEKPGIPSFNPHASSETTTLPALTPVPATEVRNNFNFGPSGLFSETCTTVDGSDGSCVSVYDCEHFVKLLSQSTASNPTVVQLLRKSHCGFEGSNPKVCCPRPGIPTALPTLPPTTTTTTTVAPTEDPKKVRSGDYISEFPDPPVCGFSNATLSRVVGGIPAKLGDFPWMALLGYKSKKNSGVRWLCGGSLISSKHILTAAHCIHGHEDDLYLVRLGELDLAREDDGATPTDILVKSQIKHAEYNPKAFTNDIGILVLQNEVGFTDLIRPVCIPRDTELRARSFENYTPIIAGWGDTEFRGPSATHLQVLQLPVVSNEFCASAYAQYKAQTIDQRVLCAGYKNGGKDACQGDSGGPLMQPIWNSVTYQTFFYQIGVVSYGKKCAEAGFPGVYTRVTHFVPWLEEQVIGSS